MAVSEEVQEATPRRRGNAEQRAGPERKRGRAWHSLRRKFASDPMDLQLEVLRELGGRKDVQTVMRCCRRAEAAQLSNALYARPRVRA